MLRALFSTGVCLVALYPYERCDCENTSEPAPLTAASAAPSPTPYFPPENDGGACWYEPGTVPCVVQLCSDTLSLCVPGVEYCYEGLSTPCTTAVDAPAPQNEIPVADAAPPPEGGFADASDADSAPDDSGPDADANE